MNVSVDIWCWSYSFKFNILQIKFTSMVQLTITFSAKNSFNYGYEVTKYQKPETTNNSFVNNFVSIPFNYFYINSSWTKFSLIAFKIQFHKFSSIASKIHSNPNSILYAIQCNSTLRMFLFLIKYHSLKHGYNALNSVIY